jgi:hypothetical protein
MNGLVGGAVEELPQSVPCKLGASIYTGTRGGNGGGSWEPQPPASLRRTNTCVGPSSILSLSPYPYPSTISPSSHDPNPPPPRASSAPRGIINPMRTVQLRLAPGAALRPPPPPL